MTLSRSHKIALLIALYLAQGLPFGFFTLALPVMLREAGFSLKAISVLSLLSLPWALKFLWAPYLDQRGARRTWLLSLQGASIIAAVLLMQLDLSSGLIVLIVAAFVFNFIAASQDVVTDGLAVRMLDAQERGLANAIQVGAYRVGMMIGGGVLLWLFARTNWTTVFACMAFVLALTMIPVWLLREPASPVADAARPAGVTLLVGWAQRLAAPGMLSFIALIFCYRYGDQIITSLLSPFLSDSGLTTETIAKLKGGVGNATSLIGALIGGWFAFNFGRRTVVLGAGLAQAAVFLLYIAAAFGMGDERLLWIATMAEGVIGTMATVALFALMMDASDPEHAGVDYTLFASTVVLVSSLGSFTGAAIADAFGYGPTFIIGAVLALAGCLVVVRVLDRNASPARVAEAWRKDAYSTTTLAGSST